jgi:hypothetical protein
MKELASVPYLSEQNHHSLFLLTKEKDLLTRHFKVTKMRPEIDRVLLFQIKAECKDERHVSVCISYFRFCRPRLRGGANDKNCSGHL